jgi:hypothetical protein
MELAVCVTAAVSLEELKAPFLKRSDIHSGHDGIAYIERGLHGWMQNRPSRALARCLETS